MHVFFGFAALFVGVTLIIYGILGLEKGSVTWGRAPLFDSGLQKLFTITLTGFAAAILCFFEILGGGYVILSALRAAPWGSGDTSSLLKTMGIGMGVFPLAGFGIGIVVTLAGRWLNRKRQ